MRFLRHVTGTNTFCIRSKTVLSVSHALYVRFVRCASVTCTVHTLLVRYLSCTRSVVVQSLCVLCVSYFDRGCLGELKFRFSPPDNNGCNSTRIFFLSGRRPLEQSGDV